LTYQGKSFLFTGDAPRKLFDAVAHNFNLGVRELLPDVLICPHHGSMSEGSYRWKEN
jgi:beta-lactamase superfamily II metal-dependent hydrolase